MEEAAGLRKACEFLEVVEEHEEEGRLARPLRTLWRL
jgi:hypothetical protein